MICKAQPWPGGVNMQNTGALPTTQPPGTSAQPSILQRIREANGDPGPRPEPERERERESTSSSRPSGQQGSSYSGPTPSVLLRIRIANPFARDRDPRDPPTAT
ncbi:hypothetical protein TWF506_010765 [Arthrobotrys conoides]|uniref:Uncharacterized protein n=1 Tax=Arthrobotrys conoides TaxID=74498 RepID=A0AAN8NS63_9PEZI